MTIPSYSVIFFFYFSSYVWHCKLLLLFQFKITLKILITFITVENKQGKKNGVLVDDDGCAKLILLRKCERKKLKILENQRIL